MYCTDKNFDIERPLVITDKKVECFRLEDFSDSSKKNATEYQQLHYLCFINNCSKHSIQRASWFNKKAWKTIRVLTKAQVFYIKSIEDWYFGKCSSKLMTFATFEAFKIFQLLTILWLFDNLDKSTTVSLSLLPLPTISSIIKSLGAKFDDLVVFNIEISGAAIYLKPWIKR